MIFELRLFKAKRYVPYIKPGKVVKFTTCTCNGNAVGYADRVALSSRFDTMQLLERHFYGPEAKRDYGYGRGYEPIMVGSI